MIVRLWRLYYRCNKWRSQSPESGHLLIHISDQRLAELIRFQKRIHVSFRNIGILDQALTHTSYVNENRALPLKSNEQMEFLGDAVLNLLVGMRLYIDFSEHREGFLTRIRSQLVNEYALERKAKRCHLGSYIQLGKGEERCGGRLKASLLADTFEALVCAIFLDQGIDSARLFLTRQFTKDFKKTNISKMKQDFKSSLQEISQERFTITPRYEVVRSEGPAHHQKFYVCVKLKTVVVGRGKGYSKRKAEQAAARMAIRRLKNHPQMTFEGITEI